MHLFNSIFHVLNPAELDAKTYLYLFNHRLSYSQKPAWVTSDHLEDVQFSFGFPFLDIPEAKHFNDIDRKTSKKFMTAINNFVRNG